MPIRLKFTNHMQERMVERSIDADHVRKAISGPDFTKKQESGKVLVRKKLEDGRNIEVVYSKEDFRGTNDYLIVTAYYPENP